MSTLEFVCVDDTKEFRKLVGNAATNHGKSSKTGRRLKAILQENLTELQEFVRAVERGDANVPSFFVLDLVMDNEDDGIQALEEIRQSTSLRNTPVIIHSSHFDQSTIEQGYVLNANSLVEKPSTGEKQLEVVKEILDYWVERNKSQ